LKVQKRNGSIEDFERQKIRKALRKCFAQFPDVSQDLLDRLPQEVEDSLSEIEEPIPVETIQDRIESAILRAGFVDAARAYIRFRDYKARLRKEKANGSADKFSFEESAAYFRNKLAEFVFMRTYARFTGKRRETWIEAVSRLVDYYRRIGGDSIPEEDYQAIFDSVLNMKVLPSMRLLSMAGPAADRDNLVIYNCSSMVLDSIQAFAELLYILMAGTGAGFSVEYEQSIDKLPRIKKQKPEKKSVWVIEDSAEGWADALRLGMEAWFSGHDVEFDYSKIRPAGSRLKTKGGFSSGPEPLKALLDFTREKILSKAGKHLDSIDVHDIACMIAYTVVSGGVRRSATISLSDFDDEDLRHAKEGSFWLKYPYRSMSNNSAVYEERPSSIEFLEEWLALAKSGTGERGIFNREAALRLRPKRRKPAKFLTNPSLAKGTNVLTSEGIFPIEELEERKFYVPLPGARRALAWCRKSGTNRQLYQIRLSNGESYFATAEHHWPVRGGTEQIVKPTSELKQGDRIPIGMMNNLGYGDEGGFYDGLFIGFLVASNDPKTIIIREEFRDTPVAKALIAQANSLECRITDNSIIDIESSEKISNYVAHYGVTSKRLPEKIWTTFNEPFRRGILTGIFASCGEFTPVSAILRSKKTELLRDLRKLLGFYGVQTYLSESIIDPKDDGTSVLGVSEAGHLEHLSYLMALLSKSSPDVARWHLFVDRVPTLFVKSVVPTDRYEDVWDISVFEENHLFRIDWTLTGNCGEIILRPRGLCNLTEVVARPEDSVETLKEKIRMATIMGTIQAKLTHFPYLNPEWAQNAKEEALLGVSITGQMDCPIFVEMLKNPHDPAHAELLRSLRDYAVSVNQTYAALLGINPAAAVTCVKPSGTASLVVDSSPGIHPRYSKYYIRRIRISSHDPVFEFLRDSGVPCVPEVGQSAESANTWVFEFPVKAPDNCVTRKDITSLQQMDYWLLLRKHWAEHSVSATIYVEDDSWVPLGNKVYENFDHITGLSFLPKDEHKYPLAPYEEITEEEYLELVDKFPDIDFSKLSRYEKVDTTTVAQEYACTAGACELI